jgi:acetolactate synthase-1/2/3 large subunit
MNGSELFVKALEKEGVTHIFGVAGEENLHFLQALSGSSIKYITTRHEQAAAFMAATIGRITGRAGVCLSTLGPGATNLVTGAAYAKLGGMPMVMITGQKPIRDRNQGNFQIVDIVRLLEPVVKYTKSITHADLIPETVREAFRNAEVEKPGPTHIELPKDISVDPTTRDVLDPVVIRRPTAEIEAINKGIEIIEKSNHPIILIGSGANRKRISNKMKAFIDHTGIPFVDTQMGKGVVDERSPYYLGTLALSSRDYVHCALEKADLIIVVGYDLDEKLPFFSKNAKILHINFFPIDASSYYMPTYEIVGDIGNLFSVLTERVSKKFDKDNEILKLKDGINRKVQEHNDLNNFPVYPQRIVADVRRAVPEDGIICLDNGMYKLWFARGYKAYLPNTILLDNALATMGAGLPSAIATKIINPDKFVMAVVGDGGFMMNSQEVETAVRLELDLIVFIINDNGFGMIDWEQKEKNYKPFGLHFKNPDFVKYAESYGARGVKVAKVDDIILYINEAKKEGGVWLIEVPVDYTENERVFTEALNHNTCQL